MTVPLGGPIDSALPAVGAGDRAGHLGTSGKPLLDQDGAEAFGRLAGIDRGGHLTAGSHWVATPKQSYFAAGVPAPAEMPGVSAPRLPAAVAACRESAPGDSPW